MRIPSHTTVAAYGALFVALGGTSYAAVGLGRNTVGTPQIKNGAVTQAKIARNARGVSGGRLSHLVAADVTTTMTSDQVLAALSGAVQGQKGDQGPAGPAGPQGNPGTNGRDGLQGPQGVQGPQGNPGEALGYVHVNANGSIDTANSSSNVLVDKPSGYSGLYCVGASNATVHNVVVSLDANDGLVTDTAQVRIPPSGDPCATSAYPFEIIAVRNGTTIDRGFYATLN